MELPAGITAHDIDTDRLRMHYLESGPSDGIPVILVHGNLSTGRFYETVMAGAPPQYRFIAPDMRGFGRSERKALDATRGVRDWADDTYALVRALGIDEPVHLAGWSTGGAAVAAYAIDRPVRSLTFIDPVSPYGFGGCHRDGTPCFPDWAGTGGGTGNPEFVERLRSGDRSADSPFSPRNVMAMSYWSPNYAMPEDRFDTANLLALPFEDDSFDLVLCLEVLEHIPDPRPALAEMARVSSSDLILSVPHEPWFRLGSLARGKYVSGFGNHPEHVNHWNPRSFREFLSGSVEPVEVTTSLPWVIARCRAPGA